jgi:hypothetical protein
MWRNTNPTGRNPLREHRTFFCLANSRCAPTDCTDQCFISVGLYSVGGLSACALRRLPSDARQKMLPLGLSVLAILDAAQKEIFIDGTVVL